MLILAAMLVPACSESREARRPVAVFCGSASKPAMEECAERFKAKSGIQVDIQFGGSGHMLSRLKMSGRGDLYIPGSPDYMIKAKELGVVEAETVQILAYLVPTILVQKNNPSNIHSLSDLSRAGISIGIGNPKAVCIGLYGVEILDKAGLLEKTTKNIAVHTESCSKTAAVLCLKKVDAILGWRVFGQ